MVWIADQHPPNPSDLEQKLLLLTSAVEPEPHRERRARRH
ncbi:hypothetical protein FM112_12210 [Gulosibacter sp. 10]|nr:hypothetical protein FM112_12210 [Gulosibacter sp. 10]